jgi:repressor LexA
MLRARGYSMINAGIKDGDLLFIRKQNYANFGEIVVALIEEETTVKRLEKKNGKIVLHPENPKFEDIYVPEDFAVLGIVDGFIRRF